MRFVFDKPEVMLARQIARANGGKLLEVPAEEARRLTRYAPPSCGTSPSSR